MSTIPAGFIPCSRFEAHGYHHKSKRCPLCASHFSEPTRLDSLDCTAKADTPLSITITGQVRGGKNNMIVTHTGLHFPKKSWAKWRDAAVAEVRAQLPKSWKPITAPVNVRLEYVSGDKRRRDMPAIVDAAWHVFEKAGVVTDDTLLWATKSTRDYDKKNPRITITILP